MSTTTGLETLKINYLTQAQYNTASQNGEINENELYMTPDNGIVVSAEDASSPENYQENSVWLKYGSASGGQADWIVEQGTEGIWTYRKWNSGFAEAWGLCELLPITSGYVTLPDHSAIFGNNYVNTIVSPWYGINAPRSAKVLLPTVSGPFVYLRTYNNAVPTDTTWSCVAYLSGNWK